MTVTETPNAVQTAYQACCAESSTCEGAASSKKVFLPRADIYETKDTVELYADLPGVDEKSLEITLEKSVLSIRGKVVPVVPEGYKAAYVEYSEGDYERSFKLAEEIDCDDIKATIKNGVLHVSLNKAGPAQARKIEVKVS